jgi:hypothetical protein
VGSTRYTKILKRLLPVSHVKDSNSSFENASSSSDGPLPVPLLEPVQERQVTSVTAVGLTYQCFGSGFGSAWIPNQLVAWIRIHILIADPDSGGLRRANMKQKKTQPKSR